MQYVYALGTRPLAQYGAAWEYLLADALGSVRQIVDGSGNVTLAESYEPYGSVLSSTGTASSIFGYSGEEADTSGLVYLRARYMQPTLGIFLARDPWSGDQLRPGSMNGFNYVDGDPVNRIDPSGYMSAECRQLLWGEPAATMWCDPYVWHQDRERLREMFSFVADGFVLRYGDWAARWQLWHYLYGDGSPSILNSLWYLDTTNRQAYDPVNGRTLAEVEVAYIYRDALPFMAECNRPVMNADWKLWFEAPYYDHVKTKLSIGRHIVKSVFYSWDPPQGNPCDCTANFRALYEIDDPYDFDPIDPVGGGPQVLNIGEFGIGQIPFEWMEDLRVNGYATRFNTRIRWLDEFTIHTINGQIDEQSTTRSTIYDY